MPTPLNNLISRIRSIFLQPTLDQMMAAELEHELKIIRECSNMITFMSFQKSLSEAKVQAILQFSNSQKAVK